MKLWSFGKMCRWDPTDIQDKLADTKFSLEAPKFLFLVALVLML